MYIGSFDLPGIISSVAIGIVIISGFIYLVSWTRKNRKVT